MGDSKSTMARRNEGNEDKDKSQRSLFNAIARGYLMKDKQEQTQTTI